MLAILFHEFGHFVVGYINGVKPQHLIVGVIKFNFEKGFHIQFNNNWIYYGGIYCYKVANYPEKAVLKLIVGGPLVSLIGSFVLFSQLEFLKVFGYFSLLLFIATAVPINISGICSDGFKAYKLLVKDDLFLLYQKVSNQLLQDYSGTTFDEVSKVCSTLESQNVPDYMINTFLLYLIYAWLLQGEMLQIRNSYQRLTEIKPSNQFNRNYYYSLLVSLEALVYKRMSSDLFAKVNLEKLDKISQKRLQYLSCFYLENSEDISEKKIAFQEVLSSYSEQKSVLVQAEKQFLV
ncbi:site-2 protease family protein [Streptococcus lutetiensis]|uniref:site-2 protease family protein n=1 Tax=Streptococcus lutetiensis TaxID=150055 RepID=UPI001F06FE1A|nr:site-2 protease family protein [Streptococcus lutetiensis]